MLYRFVCFVVVLIRWKCEPKFYFLYNYVILHGAIQINTKVRNTKCLPFYQNLNKNKINWQESSFSRVYAISIIAHTSGDTFRHSLHFHLNLSICLGDSITLFLQKCSALILMASWKCKNFTREIGLLSNWMFNDKNDKMICVNYWKCINQPKKKNYLRDMKFFKPFTIQGVNLNISIMSCKIAKLKYTLQLYITLYLSKYLNYKKWKKNLNLIFL